MMKVKLASKVKICKIVLINQAGACLITATNSFQDYRLISGYQGITSYSYRKLDLSESSLPTESQTSGSYLRIDDVNCDTEGKYACTVTARNTGSVGDIRVVFVTQLIQSNEVSSVISWGRGTQFSGSLKFSLCEERRLKDTQNLRK